MGAFGKLNSLFRRPVKTRVNVAKEMAAVIGGLSSKRLAAHEKLLADIDWNADVERFEQWFNRSLKVLPLSSDVVALWFCVPDIMNLRSKVYFVGSPEFDERPSYGDWASSVCWTQDEEDRKGRKVPKSHPAELDLEALSRMIKLLWNEDEDADDEPRDLAEYAASVAIVYVWLLVQRAVGNVPADLLFESRAWIGVGFGPASGDLYLCGVRTKQGWKKATKKHRREIKHPPPAPTHENPELDLNSEQFDIHKYVEAGLDLNAKDARGRTPLMKAVDCFKFLEYDWNLVRQMMKAGADPRPTTSGGYHVLLTLMDGPIDIIELALDMGADPELQNENGACGLNACVRYKLRLEALELLLRRGANATLKKKTSQETLLHDLAEEAFRSSPEPLENYCNAADMLLKAGADINATSRSGHTPLVDAISWWIIYHGQPTKDTGAAIQFAVELLRRGANPDSRRTYANGREMPVGATPLMCSKYGDGRLHMALLEHGANVWLKCKKGKSALDYAKAALKNPRKQNVKVIKKVVGAIERRMAETKPAQAT